MILEKETLKANNYNRSRTGPTPCSVAGAVVSNTTIAGRRRNTKPKKTLPQLVYYIVDRDGRNFVTRGAFQKRNPDGTCQVMDRDGKSQPVKIFNTSAEADNQCKKLN